jgi:hypothetical protein
VSDLFGMAPIEARDAAWVGRDSPSRVDGPLAEQRTLTVADVVSLRRAAEGGARLSRRGRTLPRPVGRCTSRHRCAADGPEIP